MALIEQRRLSPEAVTTRVVEWNAAAAAYGEPAIKTRRPPNLSMVNASSTEAADLP